jgi:hypothetical protein
MPQAEDIEDIRGIPEAECSEIINTKIKIHPNPPLEKEGIKTPKLAGMWDSKRYWKLSQAQSAA